MIETFVGLLIQGAQAIAEAKGVAAAVNKLLGIPEWQDEVRTQCLAPCILTYVSA
jgi:hypothetical protein